jgi:hypothetical protein
MLQALQDHADALKEELRRMAKVAQQAESSTAASA